MLLSSWSGLYFYLFIFFFWFSFPLFFFFPLLIPFFFFFFQRREPAHNEKERAEEIANDEGFGVKSISYFGGVALLVNNITGPAMVTIAPMFQNAG